MTQAQKDQKQAEEAEKTATSQTQANSNTATGDGSGEGQTSVGGEVQTAGTAATDAPVSLTPAQLDAFRLQIQAEERDKVLREVEADREKQLMADQQKAEAAQEAEKSRLKKFPYGNQGTGIDITKLYPTLKAYPEDSVTVLLAKHDTNPDGTKGKINLEQSTVQFFDGPSWKQHSDTSKNSGATALQMLAIEAIPLHIGKNAFTPEVAQVEQTKVA